MIHFGSTPILISSLVDEVSTIFAVTVRGISLSVFLYRYGYIKDQKFFSRFHLLLFLFVLSIVLLIFSSNLFFSMLGWDGLGVTSYLLVVYYNNSKSNRAGILTALVNRLGDFFLILVIIFVIFGPRDHIFLYKLIIENSDLWACLILGSFTKSAQIPFRAWLPAAIAAPTPVSSLVHSSTLVTAGVYLIIRHAEGLPNHLFPYIFFLGMATMTMARLSAINEKDMKKMVALSTLRQLGLIVIRIGLGWAQMAFIHLVIHAFFKALMFIAAGNIIHFNIGYQRLIKAGGGIFSTPLNTTIVIVSSMSLIGAPFAAAFFSKEPIIEIRMSNNYRLVISCLMLLGVALTAGYSIRFVGMVLSLNSKNQPVYAVLEKDGPSSVPLVIIFLPAFMGGSVISSAAGSQPQSSLYPLSIKVLIVVTVLGSVALFTRVKRFVYFKLGEFALFSIWSLSGLRSALLTAWAHMSSKSTLVSQGDVPNSSLSKNSLYFRNLLTPFLLNSFRVTNFIRSFMVFVIILLTYK